MAKVVKGDISESAKGSRYPWSDWLDGRQWELVQGVDFQTNVRSFDATARCAAKRLGRSVRISLVGSDTVRIQAYPG